MTGNHTDPDENVPPVAPSDDPAHSVDEQRAALAETLAALAAKANITTRAHNGVNSQLQQAKTLVGEKPQILVAASLGVALVAVIVLRRRRSHGKIAR